MVIEIENIRVATVTATFTVALLAALLANGQRRTVPSHALLALVFTAFAISELDTVAQVLFNTMVPLLRNAFELAAFAANFTLMPLFFFFVRDLTGQLGSEAPDGLILPHLVLPAVVACFAITAIFFPAVSRDIWVDGSTADAPLALQASFLILTIGLLVQWAFYIPWVVRTQSRHIERLKQHFASTEGLELRWVSVLAIALGAYVLQSIAGEALFLLGFDDPVGPLLDSVFVLSVVAALALWSLRPAPELDDAAETLNDPLAPPNKKYEKSALGAQQAERIARKLTQAMEADHLYRDPNLTLGILAQHIGVSLNYVSQTLNQHMGQSFFEFVNLWRVKEAIPLVEKSETTVLAIAYDVGFNSRSSFYSAFKRVTGLTPTAYKNRQMPKEAPQVPRIREGTQE